MFNLMHRIDKLEGRFEILVAKVAESETRTGLAMTDMRDEILYKIENLGVQQVTAIRENYEAKAETQASLMVERKETDARILKATTVVQTERNMLFTTIAVIAMTLGWAISNDFIKFSDGTHEIITREIPI